MSLIFEFIYCISGYGCLSKRDKFFSIKEAKGVLRVTCQLASEPTACFLRKMENANNLENMDNNVEMDIHLIPEEAANNNTLPLDQLKAYFDQKFQEQNTKLEQKERKLELRLRENKKETVDFKYRGNKVQYNFNNNLVQSLEDLRILIQDGSITRSSKRVDAMINDIKKRNKCIRFADKSPAGRAAVDEYLSDDLASDSEDDKKMKSAENRAIAKNKSSSNTKRKGNYRQQPYPSSSSYTSAAQHGYNQRFQNPPYPSGRPGFSFRPRMPTFQFQHSANNNQQRSLCFQCGQPGHWRRNCPENKQS